MPIPYKSLEDAGVDVAAAVNEAFLNNFSKGHFKAVAHLYKGQVVFDEFESRVVVGYEIQEALSFDLVPISASKINKVLVAHFSDAKRSTSAERYLDAFAPPNVKLNGEKIKVTITVHKGHTNEVDFSLDFNWAVDARCLIYFKEYSSEKKAIRLEAIRVAFTKPKGDLQKEIKDKIKKLSATAQSSASRSEAVSPGQVSILGAASKSVLASGDTEWCTKLEKLFLFLVNQVLAVQFTNFINEWELPRAIEVAQGASITPSLLMISDNHLIVGAQVNRVVDLGLTDLQAITSQLLSDFADQYIQEFSGMSDDDFRAWRPKSSPSLKWLNDQEREARQSSERMRHKTPKKAYDKNVLILSNGELFDAIAKANLKAAGGQHFEKKLDHLVKAEAGWWFTLGPSSASIIPGGIAVDTKAAVGGYVRGCLPDLNPKHWGDWTCQGICIELKTKNFGVQARPSFENDGVYCRFSLKSGSAIAFEFCNAPGWLNDLLEWISALFTRALLAALSTIVSKFKFKLLTYPEHFPGTGLEWKPRLNPTLTNQLSYLEISGDPSFI